MPCQRTRTSRCGPVARPVPPLRSKLLATLHGISFLHLQLREMKVQRVQSLSVIDHDKISFVIQEASQEHDAVIHGLHWSARVNAVIETIVRTLGNTVEDALRSVDV